MQFRYACMWARSADTHTSTNAMHIMILCTHSASFNVYLFLSLLVIDMIVFHIYFLHRSQQEHFAGKNTHTTTLEVAHVESYGGACRMLPFCCYCCWSMYIRNYIAHTSYTRRNYIMHGFILYIGPHICDGMCSVHCFGKIKPLSLEELQFSCITWMFLPLS